LSAEELFSTLSALCSTMMTLPTRRQFLSTLALGSLAARGQEAPKFPPVRVITKGPCFH
jgi:hypothetical protein